MHSSAACLCMGACALKQQKWMLRWMLGDPPDALQGLEVTDVLVIQDRGDRPRHAVLRVHVAVLDDEVAAALDPQLLVELVGQHAQRLLPARQLNLLSGTKNERRLTVSQTSPKVLQTAHIQYTEGTNGALVR
jgi:hypothetical protein